MDSIFAAPEAATIVTNGPLCEGESIVLETSAEGVLFEWIGPLGASSTTLANPGLSTSTNSTTIDPDMVGYLEGNWSVRVTNEFGCSSEISLPAPVIIYPEPEAIATIGGEVCIGENGQLFAAAQSDATYTWTTLDGELFSTQQNPVVDNPLTTTGYVLQTDRFGCTSNFDTVYLEVREAPTAQPDVSYQLNDDCSYASITLTANADAGDYDFQWTGPNGFVSSAENPIIPNAGAATNGQYELQLTDAFGCTATYVTELLADVNDPVAQPVIQSSGPTCTGGLVELSVASYEASSVSYTWFLNGTSILGTTTNTLLLPNTDFTDEGLYSVVVTVNDCEISSEDFELELFEEPTAAPSYGNTGNCAGESLQLNAGANYGGSGDLSYAWNGPNGFTSNVASPLIAAQSAASNGTYSVVVTTPSGCSVTESIIVSGISAQPAQPLAVSNGPICGSEELVLTVPTNYTGAVAYIWTNGNNEIIGSGNPLVLPALDTTAVGPFTVYVTVDGCASAVSAPVSVEITTPATPEITVDESFPCEGATLQLNASAATGVNVSYHWFFDDGNGPLPLATTSAPTYFVPGMTVGNSGVYSVSVTVDGCSSQQSNLVPVTVYDIFNAPSAVNPTTSDTPACTGDAVALQVPFYQGATYTWYGPNNFTSNLFAPVLPDVSPADAGNYFVEIELNDCATLISVPTTVYVNPQPSAPTLTNNGPLCAGEPLVLSVSSPLSNGPDDVLSFDWYDAETDAFLGSTTDPSLVLPAATGDQSGGYYVLYSLNGCTAVASTATQVTVTELPAEAISYAQAGVDQTLCAATELNLNATQPLAGSGVWTSPTGALIDDPTDANSSVSDLQMGENLFVWTLSEGACSAFSTDTVSIVVDAIPQDIAFAGMDEQLCSGTSLTLSAGVPTEATGLWTQPAGQSSQGVTIVDPSDPNTEVTGLQSGTTYTFVWSLSFESCADYSTDEVEITLSDLPAAPAYISEEVLYACGEEEVSLLAQQPAQGSGRWTTPGNGLIVSPESAVTLVADLDLGENLFVWSLSNGACADYSSDTIRVMNETELILEDDFFNLMWNDTLPDGFFLENDDLGNVGSWEISITKMPRSGMLLDFEEGRLGYRPRPNYFGLDTIEYQLCNTNCPDLCARATIVLSVNADSGEDDCYTPNLLTANGDGRNDALMFPCLTEYPNNNLMIFNRWGDKVFEAENYENDWTGTFKDRDLPPGTYYYILTLEPGRPPIQSFFTIVR